MVVSVRSGLVRINLFNSVIVIIVGIIWIILRGILVLFVVAVDWARVFDLLLYLFGLLFEVVEVPFRSLAVGEGFDERSHRHSFFFFLGEGAIVGWDWEHARY